MRLRRERVRRTLTAMTVAAGLVLVGAGCGGGENKDDEKGQSRPSSQSSPEQAEPPTKGQPTSSDEKGVLAEAKGGDGLSLSITSAVRDQGGFVTVQGTLTNGTGEAWVAAEWRGDERELARNGGSIAGASLTDQSGKKKYLVLRDTEGRCLCTRFTGGVGSGETVDWFAQFPAPPEGTTEVDFQVGSMPPAAIEISGGE